MLSEVLHLFLVFLHERRLPRKQECAAVPDGFSEEEIVSLLWLRQKYISEVRHGEEVGH